MLNGLKSECQGRCPGPISRFGCLTVDLSCEVVTEYIGCLHPDVVVDGKQGIAARLSLFKPEMSLGEGDGGDPT